MISIVFTSPTSLALRASVLNQISPEPSTQDSVLAFPYLNSARRTSKREPPQTALVENHGISFDTAQDRTPALASTRQRVTWLAGKAPRFDLTRYFTGVWRLAGEPDGVPDPIAVFVEDRKVGRLGGSKMMAYSALLDELGASLVVSGLLTSDRLWVDLPNFTERRAYVHPNRNTAGGSLSVLDLATPQPSRPAHRPDYGRPKSKSSYRRPAVS